MSLELILEKNQNFEFCSYGRLLGDITRDGSQYSLKRFADMDRRDREIEK